MAKKKTLALRKQRQKQRMWMGLACLCVLVAAVGLIVGLTYKAPLTGKHYVAIDVLDRGTITVELDADAAPITVENFLRLTDEGFYNGLTFHRVKEGFMIQGGDPRGDGLGGSDQKIKGEFLYNGVANPIAHVRGTISMARANDYNSGDSQFFIMQETAPSLDGLYAAFGSVISGMEIVDAICAETPVTDDYGSVARENQPVMMAVRRIEKPVD